MKPGRSVAGTADNGEVPGGVAESAAAATGSLRSSSVSGERYSCPSAAVPCVARPSAPSRYFTLAMFAGGQSDAVCRYQPLAGYA